MFKVYESNGVSRHLRCSFNSFVEAENYVTIQKPVCFELDKDYKGCADAYMKDGRILAIEPA